MRYIKQFAGFALVMGMALSSATVASAASDNAWRYNQPAVRNDYRMEQRIREDRLREERAREARLRAEIARDRLRHNQRRDFDDYRR